MPCFSPMVGIRSKEKTQTGKYAVQVIPRKCAIGGIPTETALAIPCGQCIGCRLERSRQWALRCVEEAKLYENNCWVTLTYNDKFLPHAKSGKVTLFERDVKLFIKRLRKKFGKGVRYYYCGEYGDELGRPHYHLCLFNFDFADKSPTEVINGNQYYESADLSALWSEPYSGESYGFTCTTDLTFESAAYTARYITKKLLGKRSSEYGDVRPEYTNMSRRPGIGAGWFDKNHRDVYPSDEVVLLRDTGPITMRPPKYFDRLLEKMDNPKFTRVKKKRLFDGIDKWKRSAKNCESVSEFIRGQREILRCAKRFNEANCKKQLKRRYENGT